MRALILGSSGGIGRALCSALAEGGVMHHITRHVLGLGQGFPGARRFRQLLSVDVHKVDDPLQLLDQATQLLEGH